MDERSKTGKVFEPRNGTEPGSYQARVRITREREIEKDFTDTREPLTHLYLYVCMCVVQ